MSEQADALATEFERVNAEVIAFVEGCSDAQWQQVVPEEQRTVAVVAHHIASAYPAVIGWVTSLAEGKPVEITMEQIDQANALHSTRHANHTRAEVADLLRRNGAAAAAAVRALDDERLRRKTHAELSVHGPTSAKQIIRYVLIGHPQGHLATLRAAIQA